MGQKIYLRFSFIPFAIATAVLGLLVLLSIIFFSQKYFPPMPLGSYTGKISGIDQRSDSFATFYAERMGDPDRLLLVVFSEGWQPLIAPMLPIKDNDSGSEKQDSPQPFQPISLQAGDHRIILSGAQSGDGYSGTVERLDESTGLWSLKKMEAESFKASILSDTDRKNLTEWLRFKSQYHRRVQELKTVDKTISTNSAKSASLTSFVKEEDALQQRSHIRQQTLTEEVRILKEEVQVGRSEVQDLVHDLAQLTRITRRGRSIDLARRVSKRENKWYYVNWQQGEDLSAIEESLAERMNVDLNKLRQRLTRARELQTLKNTVIEERSRVIELQNIYKEKIKGNSEKQEQKQKQEEKKKFKRPWWQRWDTAFGWIHYE